MIGDDIVVSMTFETFFSSEVKTRLVKFFVYNGGKPFMVAEIARRIDMPSRAVKGPLAQLARDGFVKAKPPSSFVVDQKFPYLEDIKRLALRFPPVADEQLAKEVQKTGRVRLFIIAGILINAEKARADALIVGDKISERRSDRFLRMMESSIGRELRYVLMTTDEFKYRKNMFDRFVLDILEFPHRKIINKLKI